MSDHVNKSAFHLKTYSVHIWVICTWKSFMQLFNIRQQWIICRL